MSGQEMALADRLRSHAEYLDQEGCDGTFSKDLLDAAAALRRPAPTEPVRAALEKIAALDPRTDQNDGCRCTVCEMRNIALAVLSSGEPDTNLQKMQIAPEGVMRDPKDSLSAFSVLKDRFPEAFAAIERGEYSELPPLGDSRRTSPQPAARIGREAGPYSGPMTVDASLLHALWCYGTLQPVEGVVYSYGKHQKCLDDTDRLLFDRANSLTASTPAGGWQDIATAPKDGTQILVWPYWSDRAPTQVYWRDLQRKPGRWEITPAHFCVRANPTHWQPLPMAPTDTARDAGSDVSRAER